MPLRCAAAARPFGMRRIAVLLCGALAACRPERTPEYRIGLIGHFEGPSRLSSGVPAQLGAKLAIAELNAAGGVSIGGVKHRVVLVDRPTAMRPDAAASVARELVNLDSVHAIVGPQFSALAVAAGAVAEAAEVPMITPMASAAPVTAGRAFVTRLAFLDATQGRVLAHFAYDSLGLRRVAALHNAASTYGQDIVALFSREFQARGGSIAGIVTYDEDDPTSRPQAVARVIDTRPDAILMPNFSVRDSNDLKAMRARGFGGRLLGSDSWDAVLLERRAEVLGAVLTANWDRRSDRPEVRAFITAFASAYPGEVAKATAAASYDAVRLLAAAAAQAGTRAGRGVSDALRTRGTYQGVFGTYRFNGTGDPDRGAVVLEVVKDSTILRTVVLPPP